ncbi:unnamed protein product, partial [Polarella glacialis]
MASASLEEKCFSELRELSALSAHELVDLLSGENAKHREKVAEVLWRIAGDGCGGQEAILRADGVQVLLAQLPEPLQRDEAEDTGLSAAVLGCLASLALNPGVPQAMLEASGLFKVVSLLLQPSSSRVLGRATNCVETLSLDRECREVIRRLGGIRALVSMLSSQDSGCVSAAAGALKNLSVDEESKADIASRDGLELLVELLSHEGLIACKAAECIGNFALDQAYRVRLRSLGCVAPLLNLLGASGSVVPLQLAAGAALLNLTLDDESKAAVVGSRPGAPAGAAVSLLLRSCRALETGSGDAVGLDGSGDGLSSTESSLRLVSVMILANLSAQADCAAALAESGAAMVLARCLKDSNALLREKAAAAIWNMASRPASLAPVRE